MSPQTFQVGHVRVHLLSDGIFWSDGGAAFGVVPRALWEKVVRPDAQNRIPMELRSLVIESSEGLILVDTGYGDKLAPKRREQLSLQGEKRLLQQMAVLGFAPEDVRWVINTHLHGDHCGGNTALNDSRQPYPTFSKATYLIQRLELADATYPNERTRNAYFCENFLPLITLCQDRADGPVRVLSGDTQVAPEVRTMVTPGHTRAHQIVIVESQGETAVFLGDVAGYAINMERLAWVPAFDVEPLISIETKRSLRDWASRRDALLFFQHDIATAAGRMRRLEDEWYVEAVGR